MDEAEDVLEELPSRQQNLLNLDSELMLQILADKKGEANKYASYWEQDETDICEASKEEIENNPELRTLWAGENGDMDVLKEMIEKNPDLLQCRDSDGYSPLHRASYNGHLNTIEYLLEKGADVNCRTNDNWTPLHSTAAWGQHEAAMLLLSYNANVNSQTAGGQTPLHLASCSQEMSLPLLETFVMHPRLDVSLKNNVGETARDIALRSCPYFALFDICDKNINTLTP